MAYWFEDPALKALLPLATAAGIRGLMSSFSTPQMFMGANVLPEGPGLLPGPGDVMAKNCPNKRCFVVTDEFGSKFMPKITKFLGASGFTSEIWAKAEPEAPIENVRECGDAMTKFEPDLIMAVGGGSVIDGAKGAWIHYERPDVEDLGMLSPLQPLNIRKKAILAAVPTTAGTGSECTGAAVLHDHAAHRKIPIASGELLPDYAILSPELTISMPPKLTAGTGLDVLAHSMDSVCSGPASELTDAIGLVAIDMVFKFLPRAYNNGKEHEARSMMMKAAAYAGISFGNAGAALTHSFGHAVGSIFNYHHGLMVGMFIPYCLQFYSKVADKHVDIAHKLRVEGKTSQESLANVVNEVRSLFRKLDVPLSMKELGIPEDKYRKEMEKMVLYSYEDIDTFFSPRPITPAQMEQLLNYAYDGKDVDF